MKLLTKKLSFMFISFVNVIILGILISIKLSIL
jgi:hypothetical protein